MQKFRQLNSGIRLVSNRYVNPDSFYSPMPRLFIFAGLPGTGKTTISQRLATETSACHLRIDTIEQAIRDLCHVRVEGEGYRLAYRIAADNLRLGLDVIADSCNPVELTRSEWESVATANGSGFLNIEMICTDVNQHRQRIESRKTDVDGLTLPDWQSVKHREYEQWSRNRIVIDTAAATIDDSFAELMQAIAGAGTDLD